MDIEWEQLITRMQREG